MQLIQCTELILSYIMSHSIHYILSFSSVALKPFPCNYKTLTQVAKRSHHTENDCHNLLKTSLKLSKEDPT